MPSPKEIHAKALEPVNGTLYGKSCDYVTDPEKRRLPGLSKWAQCNHSGLHEGKAEQDIQRSPREEEA